MNRFRKTTDNLFGYNRREKRATLTLVIFLIILFIIRFISLPREKPIITVNITGEPGTSDSVNLVSESTWQLYPFNPNTVTKEGLLRLGLTSRQASTLISYRNSGARFRKAEDLGRVYGISSEVVNKLKPYIIIEDEKNLPVNHIHSDSIVVKERVAAATDVCLLELNSCTREDLLKLPGIGEALSERIIRFRELLGGFVSAEQLGEVYGIDTSLVGDLLGMVYVNTDSVRKIPIDTCGYKRLARHPYIGPAAARSILKYRELIGPPSGIDILVREKVIDSLKASRMAPYCSFTRGGSYGSENAVRAK